MAGALVGGAFLSATFQVLLDRLASREIVNFFRARKHDDKLLKKLELALLTINVVLEDAEEKEFTNLAVKGWLDELKDAVYQADDFLDEIATEAMRSKFEANDSQSSTNQVRDFDDEINQIIEKLEHFAKQKDVLGLKIVQRKLLKRLPTTSLVDESAVYGRDDDGEKIVNLLCDDVASNEIRVIPIVGMGGIGKTTLAQLAYNDRRVDEYFHTKAWVCVSEEFDVLGVTKTILAAVDQSASDVSDLNLLQIKLKEKLSGKKFLIVLDDVWNDNYDDWDKLRRPFRDGAQGSKIIVTTRNESVALIMRTVPTHPLEPLSDLNCWFLIAKHAFVNGGPSAHPKLESIGKEIAKKCKGLPLAAKTLGGLLRSKLDIEEWENILNSSIWDLPQVKNNVFSVLRLSYHYLPSNLKRCFAYCSTFPNDCEFEKEELVLLWIALGFVPKQPKGNKEMEQEGDDYFCELLSRSFFQRSSANKSCFVIHDLVRDLAQLISGEFCFRLENDKPYNVSEKVRYFSYFIKRKSDIVEKLKDEAKYLRTFIKYKHSPYFHIMGHLDNQVLHNMFSSLRCLRVLSLSWYMIYELPDSIGNLTHLRYLDLSHNKIQVLPDSITTLWNLQTLSLLGCRHLIKLPVEMWKLVNLRHLYTSGTCLIEMPMHISRIVGIQHLSTFLVGTDTGRRINELGKLCHLRGELSIQGLQNVTIGANASDAKLKDKKHLANLELTWSGMTNDTQNERDVLDKLQPHASLKNLTICNYGGTEFPDWLGQHSFSSLVSLCLSTCVNCLFLPPLGQLPSLKDLSIVNMDGITRVGEEFYGNASLIKPFQSLEILRFQDMENWVEWCILGIGEFSCLLELYIIECPKLTVHFPYHISCLERLQIIQCEKLVGSLPDGRVTFLSDQVGLLQQHLSPLRVLKISRISTLQEFPSLCGLKNLEELEIHQCPSLESFPNTGLPTALKKLEINGCRKLEFPLSVEMEQCYTSLEYLTIRDSCDSLKALPLGFPKLLSLEIVACTNFETLSVPNEIQNLASLHISNCPNMVSFPRGRLPAPNLTWIWIENCMNLKLLTEGMHLQLPSLQYLSIAECPELESFPEEGLPSSLLHLSILYCKKLMNRRMEFPDDMLLLPSSLTSLDISFPNLKSLNHKALQHLTSLQKMCISNCPNLQSLPEGLPTSLSRLEIFNCPLLKPRCERGNGADWSKISRIPFIHMDYEIINGGTR